MTPSDASPNRWSDLDRPPLNVPALRRELRPGGLWTSLDVVNVTGSTNTDLAARAAGLTEGTVLVAEEQTAGAAASTGPGRRPPARACSSPST